MKSPLQRSTRLLRLPNTLQSQEWFGLRSWSVLPMRSCCLATRCSNALMRRLACQWRG